MNFEVYTVGGIEILSQVYKGIVMILGDTDFEGFLKLFASLGLISAVIALAFSAKMQNFMKHFALSFFIFNLCFTVRANVTIIDTKFNQTYVVSKVPAGPAYVSYLFSTTAYYITSAFQTIFHTGTVTVWNLGGPADNAIASVDLDYQRTGYGGFFDYLSLLREMEFYRIANPDVQDFNSRLDAFLYQCTIREISVLTQAQIEDRIKKSTNLWEAIRPQVNQFMDYGGLTTCADFYSGPRGLYELWTIKIKPMFDGTGNTGILAFLGLQPAAIPFFQSALTEALAGGSASLGDNIGQAGLIHALDNAYKRYVSNSPNAAQYFTLMYETGRNIEESKQMGRSIGLYAKEVVPYLKIAFEAICIAILPIIALLVFLPGYAAGSLRNYIISAGTVYMWDPVLAAINGLVNISYISRLHTALQAAGAQGALNIISYNTMAATTDFFPSVAGYLGLFAPALAYGIVRGGMEVVFSSVASMVATPVTSTPPHQEAASSAETQKLADQTGRSFGEVEYSYNAAGQAKLTAMAYQKRAGEAGRGDMFDSAYGHSVWDQARGAAELDTFKQHGFQALKTGAEGNLEQGIASGTATHKFVGQHGLDKLTSTGLTGLQASAANAEVTRERLGADFSNYLTEARFNQAGSQARMDMYRNGLLTPARAVQVESRSLASTMGMQQKDIMRATALGFIRKSDVEQGLWGSVNAGLQAYKNWDGMVTRNMEERLHDAGWMGVREGMRFNMEKGIGINQDTGEIDFLRGEIAGRTYSGRMEGNRLTQEHIDENGFDVKTVTDTSTGRLSHAEAMKTLDKDTRIGDYTLGAGTRVVQAMGEGGVITTYSGVINGKEGHLTVGADGRAVFADGRGGKSFDHLEIDRKTVDTTTTVQSGFKSMNFNERTLKGCFRYQTRIP